jgi:hypothetical protein
VAYIRALQRSQRATVAGAPPLPRASAPAPALGASNPETS